MVISQILLWIAVIVLGTLVAALARQVGILDRHGGDAGVLQLLHSAHDVQRVAVAVVGIDHQRQVGRAADAPGLVGKFAERQHDQDRSGRSRCSKAEFSSRRQ